MLCVAVLFFLSFFPSSIFFITSLCKRSRHIFYLVLFFEMADSAENPVLDYFTPPKGSAESLAIDISKIAAPMVNQSDAPFRALCMKYGVTCAFSEMLYSEKIVDDDKYLSAYIPHQDFSFAGYKCIPLIVQICGNNPDVLSRACERIASITEVSGVDLNLGCPQERAKEGLYGSYLLDKKYWPLVFDCARSMHSVLERFGLLLSCKIRLLDGPASVDSTIEFCRYFILKFRFNLFKGFSVNINILGDFVTMVSD